MKCVPCSVSAPDGFCTKCGDFIKTVEYMPAYPKESFKKKSIAQLDKDLWELASEFTRRRDSKLWEKAGGGINMVKCFTCNHVDHWKYMQAGHFIGRRHVVTRFLEMNLNTQCPGCNECEDGNMEVYAKRLDEVYGPGTAADLEALSKSQVKWMACDYIEKIDYFKLKIKSL
jgi:hypothetical protein